MTKARAELRATTAIIPASNPLLLRPIRKPAGSRSNSLVIRLSAAISWRVSPTSWVNS